jgi:hypothetical protein
MACTHMPRSATGEVLSLTFLLLHSSFLCSLTIPQHDNHRFTAANNADPGLLLDELHDLLHDLTSLKRNFLIARY